MPLVPEKIEWHPSVGLAKFKQLIRAADIAGIQDLTNGLIQLIMADLDADASAGKVPLMEIHKHFNKYYKVIENNERADKQLVQSFKKRLEELA